MNRLIPGKTKVQIELFRGVTIGDAVIGGVAMVMLVLVLISSLPWKLPICAVVVVIAALLVVRIDEEANYCLLMRIIAHFAYDRSFMRLYNDQMLIDRAAGRSGEAAFQALFVQTRNRTETAAERRSRVRAERAERKQREKERRREDRLLASSKTGEEEKAAILEKRRLAEEEAAERAVGQRIRDTVTEAVEQPRETREEKKERARQRREEDRILRNRKAAEEEKEAIRNRRNAEAFTAMRRAAVIREEHTTRRRMERIMPFVNIRGGCIEYEGGYFGGVIEIDPVEFRFFSETRRRASIEGCMGRILRTLHGKYCANIIKLERPVNYGKYLDRERDKLEELRLAYESGMLTEQEYQVRVEIGYDRINELRDLCEDHKIVDSFYYIALFDSDKRQLDQMLRDALESLRQGELSVRRLDTKELAVFLKYSNQLDFDEREIDALREEDYTEWAMPEVVDIKSRRVEINHIVTHNFRVAGFPAVVGDAWLAHLMSMPATKVVVKCSTMDRDRAVRGIDRSLVELRGQWSATGVDSKRMEIEEHLATLQELLTTLQGDNEVLLECNVYVTAYDISATRNDPRMVQPPPSQLFTISDMKRGIRRAWREEGFRLSGLDFNQTEAFLATQVSAYDPMGKQGRGIPSNTVAACYPWIFAHISDEGGVRLGESSGVPVFINFFRRDSERVNSNMVIVGKSGSGKSYAAKSLLANLAAEDAKIFILDPENEYTELAENLHGKFINVGNAQYGRLNPFQIITALDDDEEGEGKPSGSYATHLQFLEEFFRQILPDVEKDALEYLNNMVDRVYLNRGITAETDLSTRKPTDYPIFDDLYEAIFREFQKTDNAYLLGMLRTLMNYVAKFSEGGRNANIWNGPSTVTTEENFTVFNFQSMLANRNTAIANAQMLLVLKYIDNEIIKNRDYNLKYGLNRKIVVVIDEAHVFIDAKYPIALDFMFQLAKRIRKYNGMQIVITQNIKDFVGSEEIARKSTAIINACQYSFIFSLAPNDIQDLVRLYANAGGINENEQEQIVQAPRGQAFTIMSPASRSTFRVDAAPAITRLFETRNCPSRFFDDAEGEAFWEDFVAESRARRQENGVRERAEEETAGEQTAYSGFAFEEISGDEFDRERLETDATAAFAFEEPGGDVFDRKADESFALEESSAPEEPQVPSMQETTVPNADGAAISELASAVKRLSEGMLRSEVDRAVAERMNRQSGEGEDLRWYRDTIDAQRREIDELRRQLESRQIEPPAGPVPNPSLPEVKELREPEATAEAEGSDNGPDSFDAVWDGLSIESAPTSNSEADAAKPSADDEFMADLWADDGEDNDDDMLTSIWQGIDEDADSDDIMERSIHLMNSLTALDKMYAGEEQVMEISLEELLAQARSEY